MKIINKYQCNINGYYYDLENFLNQSAENYTVNGYQYYFRIGKALVKEELPSYCSSINLTDVQAVRCDESFKYQILVMVLFILLKVNHLSRIIQEFS